MSPPRDHDRGECNREYEWGQLAATLTSIEKTLADFAPAVEELKAWRNKQLGAMTVIGSASGVIGSLVAMFINWMTTKGN